MNNFQGKRVLITGAGGYLAGHLIAVLTPLHAEIRCLSGKEKISAFTGTEWIQGDLCDPKIWQRVLPGVDTVFYLAAQTSARVADGNPDGDYKINVAPVLDLIRATETYPGLNILFAGTATQCGIPNQWPVNETHPDFPITAYDRHKLLAEKALLAATAQKKCRAASLRFSNLYGPGRTSRVQDRGILNQMASRALQGQPLTLIKEVGPFLRDYLYVADAAEALLSAASSIDKISGEYYVIGSGQGHTLAEVFQKVASQASQKMSREIFVTSITAPLSPIDRRNFVADSTLFRQKTGWSPRVSLDQGIELMIEELSCVS